MTIELIIFCISLLSCTAIAYMLGKFWFGDVRNRKLISIFVLGSGIFLWTLLSAIPPVVSEQYFVTFEYFRLALLYSMPYLVFWFSLQFTDTPILKKPWFSFLLFSLWLITLIFLLTNPLHGLLFIVYLYPGPPISGPLFLYLLFFTYIINSSSICLLVHYAIKRGKKNPILILSAIGLVIPFTVAILRHLYIIPFFGDITPLSYSVTNFLFLYVAYRSGLLNINSPALFLHMSNLMTVVNNVSAILLESDAERFDADVYRSMGLLAGAVDADRVHIWKNSTINNELCISQMYEWSQDGDLQQRDNFVINLSYNKEAPLWRDILSQDKCVNGLTREQGPIEKKNLLDLKVVSVLAVPILLNDEFWGFMSFDDCRKERVFSKNEETILRAAGRLVINAIVRNGLIRELVSTAAQLEAARAQAEQSNHAKSDFLARMSHEIRTPMNAIIGIAQIQMQNRDLPKEQAQALGKIYSSGNNLLAIINDILDLSKIETGRMEIVPIEYYVPSLISDTVQLNMVRIGSKPLDFLLDIDENLPSKLIGDELRIKQILNNLLSNAIKYTDKGHIQLTVKKEQLIDKDHVMIRFIVGDTGQGMKAEDVERLFSEYSRFNIETNWAIEGTGMGLNITKNLIELMGGTIEATSEYGKGSTFTVTIIQEITNNEIIGPELSQQLSSFTYTAENQFENLSIIYEAMPYGRVLIVDDVDTNLFVAKGLMSPYELQIDTATNGLQAIEKVQSGSIYDVIFMDHMMPGMDGIETVRIIREREEGKTERVPIIALTANALAGNEELFLSKGFDGFISKPIDIGQLDETLKLWIRDRHPNESGHHSIKTYKEERKTGASIQAIPGIDIQSGLKMTNGYEDLYIELLVTFCDDIQERLALLGSVPDTASLGIFTTEIHALKSAAHYIGALDVSDLAAELEAAGEAKDLALIQEKLPMFVEELIQLDKNIKEALP